MSVYPYQPPEREYADTLLTYRDFTMASQWSARVEPDPLGPVNKIVSLWRGERCVAKVLTHVPAGAKVELCRDDGGYTIPALFELKNRYWDARGTNKPPEIHTPRPPGWRIQIDGRTVLAVTDTQLTPTPPPTPKPPLRQRMRHALRQQWRDDCDRIAERLGYHRAENCTGWDE